MTKLRIQLPADTCKSKNSPSFHYVSLLIKKKQATEYLFSRSIFAHSNKNFIMIKIITYNINGIRAGIKKGLLDWLTVEDPDIFCLQETKIQEHQLDPAWLMGMGYHAYWHSAEKKGYSSVATFTKKQPKQVIKGISMEIYDREGRVLRTDYDDFTLLNCYFPSGTSSEERHLFKMDFLRDFSIYVDALLKVQPNLIIVGDYNIVHTELDIHNPQRKDNPSGYRPEERQWLSDFYDHGFVDSFRYLHPEERSYSWWTYRAGARANNKGWRIDYIAVSNPLRSKLAAAAQLNDVVHSDHCPVMVKLRKL